MKPIGYVRSPFLFKNGTPRQPTVCQQARGIITIEKSVFNNPEHSLEGLQDFTHVWILFIFHQNNNSYTKAKVKPPRLNGKRVGLFSTRSPYRPNNVGLTLAKIESISGATLTVSGIDMIDGTPVIDIKPYIWQYDCPSANSPVDTGPDRIQCDGATSNSMGTIDVEKSESHIPTTNQCHVQCDTASISNNTGTIDVEKSESHCFPVIKPCHDHVQCDTAIISKCLENIDEGPADGYSTRSIMKSGHDRVKCDSSTGNIMKHIDADKSDSSIGIPARENGRDKIDSSFDTELETPVKPDTCLTKPVSKGVETEDSTTRRTVVKNIDENTAENSSTVPVYVDSFVDTELETEVLCNNSVSSSVSKPEDNDTDNRTTVKKKDDNAAENSSTSAVNILRVSDNAPEISYSKSALWIDKPPVHKLNVRFTPTARKQLQQFSTSGPENSAFRLNFLKSSDEASEAICNILHEDPRSTYRRKHCVDNLYYFTFDVIHVTCWFDDGAAEVVRLKPASLVERCKHKYEDV